MAKILVTGGVGFIGSHVVDLFLAKGYEVVVLDDLSPRRISNLDPQAKFYQMDIRSRQVWDVLAAEKLGENSCISEGFRADSLKQIHHYVA